MTRPSTRTILLLLLLLIAGGGAWAAWQAFRPAGLPLGFARGNGRIEGVELDVSTKIAGRIADILVNEGDLVAAGQVVAHMDTATLEAQLREAQAQLRRAEIAIETANALVTQRQAEHTAAEAVVAQRDAQLIAAQRRLARTEELASRGNAPIQTLDDDRASYEGTRAAQSAARAQVAAADAAIGSARSQVVSAQAAAEAARATIQRIQVDIDDSALKAPRAGRVQFRIAQPGEVVAAGGRVLNLVDLTDVYMTFFLPTVDAGRVALGSDARIILDAAPQYVIPATISLVSDVAQFTPRTVETEQERLKLVFRIRARIDPALLREHVSQVKTGLPGMAYVRLDRDAEWPANLQVRLPQ
ncbi:HlyD family efflux transporter periplasmic adaptor subunit [Roseomonas sp. HJA6]|uniref:HlyD family efflux transporter periplasmic adaptor subunit n=1 Tax=Roseomonas alba TaxID=2846776 RepID=A0ABS7A8G8_9PROT|nr:HlyD family efflux transporter periplasmic adaptor subunit [Neoroseomonas alba]MBW6398593.1 HlyD family efflux transporter periplasmic adaptor subunit [Neoroseomonas alba]